MDKDGNLKNEVMV
jgi:hypothetical protein